MCQYRSGRLEKLTLMDIEKGRGKPKKNQGNGMR